VSKEEDINIVNRRKRDVFDASALGAEPDFKRFDPFRFGSSDRFSHGFGKRHISNSASTA